MHEEKWITKAKEEARFCAKNFWIDLCCVADDLMVERDWFMEEFLKAFNEVKGENAQEKK